MDETKPRRLFGLLCAHEWQVIGTRERKWRDGRTQSTPLLQCRHCGDMKVAP